MKQLEGRVAVIAGGNSSLGLVAAKLLAEHGAKVAVAGRDAATLDATAKSLGANAIAVECDVTVPADVDRLFAIVRQKFGKIDILFANAAVAEFFPWTGREEDVTDQTFEINVQGVFFTLQKAIPHLNDGAAIIVNTSFPKPAGLHGDAALHASEQAAAFVAAYALLAKIVVGIGRGLTMFTRTPQSIRVGDRTDFGAVTDHGS